MTDASQNINNATIQHPPNRAPTRSSENPRQAHHGTSAEIDLVESLIEDLQTVIRNLKGMATVRDDEASTWQLRPDIERI